MTLRKGEYALNLKAKLCRALYGKLAVDESVYVSYERLHEEQGLHCTQMKSFSYISSETAVMLERYVIGKSALRFSLDTY